MPQGKQERPMLLALTSVLAGSAIAAGICLLVLALAAWLIAGGKLGPEWLERGPLAGAFAGALAGGGYAVRCVGRRALVTGLAVGAGFTLLCLLFGTLLPGGTGAGGITSTATAALVGGALAGVLFSGGKKRRK